MKVWLIGLLVLGLLWGPLAFTRAMDDDLASFPECTYCGMKRKAFAHSRMMVYHGNGESVGVCSLNCAVIDYVRDVDDSPGSLKVGDYGTKKLIDADRAYWVLGGDLPGVMTNRAKWAFEDKSAALLFIKRHGGELISFEEAVKTSYVDIFEDMRRLKVLKREYSRVRHPETARSRIE
ncbi:MAG: nitrous oxide reductase accessory protein NosL [Syntrophobacteraceae bacterium]